jgi:hypothetical protein
MKVEVSRHGLDREAKELLREATAAIERNWRGPVGRKTFLLTEVAGRRLAVIDYGTGFYDEGIPVYLIVCLDTGAYITLTPSIAKSASSWCLNAFFDPTAVPADDAVRRWLATGPASGPVRLLIDTPDRLERYCAAEIVRTDQPERIAQATVDVAPELGLANAHYLRLTQTRSAGDLPYSVVFGPAIYPVTEVGSGRGRGSPALPDGDLP